jgi:hypothetical protein
MNKRRKMIYLAILCSVMLFVSPSSAFAQEGGFSETFDDAQLTGWDHSPEVVVIENVMRIGPGNFAHKMGNFTNFNATFQMKFTGPGIIFFRYNVQEGKDYACIFFQDRVVIEKITDGVPQELGSAEWSGFSGDWDTIMITTNSGQHSVSVNDQVLLSAQDVDEPYSGGGFSFIVEGESSADFDNLEVTVLTSNSTSEGGAPDPEDGAAVASPTAQPAAKTGLEGFLTQLTASRGNPPDLVTSVINLLLSVVLAFILSRVYVHWGSALSNRRRFAANFILITITTTFIILIVRSSIALSLGLVGALSIVRFRAAIKEPEELAYIFFAISIGIGLGDNQRLITVLAVSVAILVIAAMRFFRGRAADFNLHLTVASSNPGKVSSEVITDTLKQHATQARMMRFDENKQNMEVSYLVEFKNNAQFEAAKTALQALSKEIEITFLDNKGIG